MGRRIPFARRFGIPVLTRTHARSCPARNLADADEERLVNLRSIHSAASRSMTCWCRRLRCRSDAARAGPVRVSDGASRLGVLTTPVARRRTSNRICPGCDALVLDVQLRFQYACERPYPAALKTRIASRLGHLDNRTRGRYSRRSIAAGSST